VWGCLAKVMLPDFKKRKIGSKISDCLFLGYAEDNAAYRFLVLNNEIIECCRNRGHDGDDEQNKIIFLKEQRSCHHILYGKIGKLIKQVCENRILGPGVGYVWRRY